MINSRLNHRVKVLCFAEIITSRQTLNKPMFAIDVNRWGISSPFSDPESTTIYRNNLFELSSDTFIECDLESNEPHYANDPYASIHDY